MKYNFEFKEFRENYPSDLEDRVRHRFIELCNTILYSDDQKLVNKCYDILFSSYRGYILNGHPAVKCSQFEEVILKILNDEENSTSFIEHGVSTSPFMRYLALIKEADMIDYTGGYYAVSKSRFKKFENNHKIDLKSYLFMFVAEHNDKIKNNLMRRLIHKYVSDMC